MVPPSVRTHRSVCRRIAVPSSESSTVVAPLSASAYTASERSGTSDVEAAGLSISLNSADWTDTSLDFEYYPPQLDNWFTDSWIVYAYVALPAAAGAAPRSGGA